MDFFDEGPIDLEELRRVRSVLFSETERPWRRHLGCERYTDCSPHSQFAPFFSETFRPQLILRKDVSPPPYK